MKTNPEIYLQSACQKNSSLRSQLEKVRSQVKNTISNLNRSLSTISESIDISYTDFQVLLKRDGDGWTCVGIVDINNLPDDMEDDWDLVLPIPNPESIPEFSGW